MRACVRMYVYVHIRGCDRCFEMKLDRSINWSLQRGLIICEFLINYLIIVESIKSN